MCSRMLGMITNHLICEDVTSPPSSGLQLCPPAHILTALSQLTPTHMISSTAITVKVCNGYRQEDKIKNSQLCHHIAQSLYDSIMDDGNYDDIVIRIFVRLSKHHECCKLYMEQFCPCQE